MNDDKIVLFARLKVKADKIEQLKAAALKIVADSRGEAGNINYDVHQSIEDETLFFWHETWAEQSRALTSISPHHFSESFSRRSKKLPPNRRR